MPADLAKVFLKVINIYYQEPLADTIDFGHQDENYNYNNYFLLATNLSAQMMSTNEDDKII